MTKVREGYKETEIGVIPEDWEVSNIGKCSSRILGGGTPPRNKPEYYNGKIPWITVKDMDGQFFKNDALEYVTPEAIKNSSTNLIDAKSVIVATRMGLGRGFINTIPVAINQDLKAIILNNDIDSTFFLFWYLSKASIIENLGTGTTVKGIRLETLNALKLPLPPPPEQQRIAEILSTTDAHIEKLDKTIEDYQLLKKGMMKKLLTEGIGHTEFKETEIGRIPKEWEVVQVIKTYKKQRKELYIQLKTNEYKTCGKYPIVDQGQSLICGYTDDQNKMFMGGLPVIVFGDHTRIIKYVNFDFAVGADGTQLLKPLENFDDKFYYYALANLCLINQGYSRHFKYLNESFIAVPSCEEQRKISDILWQFDLHISALSKEKNDFIQLKKSLMEKLLTGKIRVNSLQMEV